MPENYVKLSISRILFKLRMFREMNFKSQSEAAVLLGVGLRSYQRIEAGESVCDISFLLRFCRQFNVDFDDLVSPSPPRSCRSQTLFVTDDEISRFESLPEITQSQFLELSQFLKTKFETLEEMASHHAFVSFPHKLLIYNAQKKYYNNQLVTELNLSKNIAKTFAQAKEIDTVVQILDNLHFHRPKYSMIYPCLIIPGFEDKQLRAYNCHWFRKNNDTISISLIDPILKDNL